MKKFVCLVCGYVYEGEAAPEICPVCKAPAEKFKEQSGEMTWAAMLRHQSLLSRRLRKPGRLSTL